MLMSCYGSKRSGTERANSKPARTNWTGYDLFREILIADLFSSFVEENFLMSTSTSFDFLPTNVLTLAGYDFFQFIKNTLGEPEANLLSKIAVKTTFSFILIEDPLDIFYQDVDDQELDQLKETLCFKLKNERFLIKPGVLSGFRSLREALKNKLVHQEKNPKRKQQPSTSINTNGGMIPPQKLPTVSTTTKAAAVPMSFGEHRSYVSNLINKWCEDNKENFDLSTFRLEEGVDFTLSVELEGNSVGNASIKCKCRKIVSLGKNDDKIQVSNYYKHLQSAGCGLMKELKNAEKQMELEEQQEENILPKTASSISFTTSSANESSDEPSSMQSRSLTSSVKSASQSQNGGKRRLTKQLQPKSSVKRSRS